MSLLRAAVPIAVAFAVAFAVTVILWFVRSAVVGPQHLVFFYLVPIAAVAIVYGAAPAMLCAAVAALCAAYFLYDPIYSFYVASRLEVGELVCFALLAVIAVKCTVELIRWNDKIGTAKPGSEIS